MSPSIFSRPDSPPPRAPSPDIVHTPLPSPYLRPRIHSSSSQQSLPSPAPFNPPGLSPFVRAPKTLLTVRSCDHLTATGSSRPDHIRASTSPLSTRTARRTRSNLSSTSSPGTPRSLQLPPASPVDSAPHRRCLSNASPRRSPPPSPALPCPPPPVPPIPSFILTSSSSLKPAPSPPASPITPIRLPELDSLSPLSETTNTSHKRTSALPSQKSRSVGMTCLKFFTLRNSKRKTTQNSAA